MLIVILFKLALSCDLCAVCESVGCSTCIDNSSIRSDSAFDCICNTGYYRLNSTYCIKCPDLCLSCESDIKCTECKTNAELSSDLCYCKTSYIFNSSSGVCDKCPDYCNECKNSTYCLTCSSSFGLIEGKCCCLSGYYLNSSLSTCETCSIRCKTCENNEFCLTCYDSANLEYGLCVCKSGFYVSSDSNCTACPSTCKSCSSSKICEECLLDNSYPDKSSEKARCLCSDGYFFCDEKCSPCHATCKKCSESICSVCIDSNSVPDLISSDGSCKCNEGYYLNDLTCDQCHGSCKTCNETSCITCISSKAQVKENICSCLTGYYSYSDTECLSCDISCAECNQTNCLACYNDQAEINKKQCKCPLGTYTKNFHRTCLSCPSNCSSCTGADSCLSCKDQNAETTSGVCLCKPGYTFTNDACVKCHETCKSCDSNSVCLNCKDQNSHVSLGTQCVCNSGYYLSTICEACDPTCASCNDQECLECKYANSQVVGTKCECFDGYFLNETECSPCDSICVRCEIDGCLECIEYATLDNGVCDCDRNRVFFNGSCVCGEGFVGEETCVKCKKYLEVEDVEVYFNSYQFSFNIYFLIDIQEISSFDCNDILTASTLAKLGDSPICYWDEENYGITILIGSNSNFSGNYLELNPEAFTGLESECKSTPSKLIIPLTIDEYNNETLVKSQSAFSILGPELVSKSCTQSVTYTAVTIVGSKNIKSIDWTSDPVVPITKSGLSATFSISALDSNFIDIILISINMIGPNTYQQISLEITEEKVLEIYIKNGKNIITRSSDSLFVSALISNDCGATGDEFWNWTLVSMTGPQEDLINLSNYSNQNTLYIPSRTLKQQINYTFSVQVVKASKSGETSFYVYVQPEELVLILNRGSGSISSEKNTSINASDSYDPDGELVMFLWTLTNYSDEESFTSSSITLLPEYISNSQITVELMISTSTKSKSTTLVLYPSILRISIICPQLSSKQNFPLNHSVSVLENIDYKINWKGSSNKIISKSNTLQINSLLKSETFKFTISVNSSEFFGFATMTPNLPGVCADFNISSSHIKAYEDIIVVTGEDCYDQDESDYPLTYNFGLINPDLYLNLITGSFISQQQLLLFNGKFFIWMQVCDGLYSCSKYKSGPVVVEKSNYSNPDVLFNKLKDNPTEAVIIAVNNAQAKLSDNLTVAMWTELKKGKIETESELENFLSAMLALAKDKNFNFNEFLKVLRQYKLAFNEKSMDLIFEIQDIIIQNGVQVNKVFNLNKILVKALEIGKGKLELGDKFEKEMKNFKIFKSKYVGSPIGPYFIENMPVFDPDEIINFQIISYQSPNPAFSLLFTKSGKITKKGKNEHDEEEIKLRNLELLLTFKQSNKTKSTCIYSNETGDYTEDGCTIISSNSTHKTLEITHTSFYYLETYSNLVSSSSDCNKYYAPCYILNFLVISCPLIVIFFKISRKPEPEGDEQVNLKQENDEEHKDQSNIPSKTMTEDISQSKTPSMRNFHLYLGVYHNEKYYLSSLKVFSILCAQVSNLFFVGLFLAAFNDVQKDSSASSFISLIPYTCYAFILTIPIQCFLHYTFTRPRDQSGYVLASGFAGGLVFLLVTSIHIIMYNYSMCEDWAEAWSLLYSLTVLYEFAFHSIVMFALYAFKPVSNRNSV